MIDALEPRRHFAVYRPELDWANEGVYNATSADAGSFYITPIGLQRDNKLLFEQQGAVLRLNTDGSLDHTWAGPLATKSTQQVERLSSGRFLRFDRYTMTNQLAVTRFHADGTLDTQFGAGGIRQIALPLSPRPGTRVSAVSVVGVAETPNGGVALLLSVSMRRNGKSYVPPATVIMRTDPLGRTDPTFNGTGFVNVLEHTGEEPKIGVDRYGRISIGGTFGTDTLRVRRLNVDGTPDRRFDTDGVMDVETKLYDVEDFWDPLRMPNEPLPVPFGFARDGSFYYRDAHATGTQLHFYGIRHRNDDGTLDTGYAKSGWLRSRGYPYYATDGSILAQSGRTLQHFLSDGAANRAALPGGTAIVPQLNVSNRVVLGRSVVYSFASRSITKLTPREPILLDSHGILHLSGGLEDDLVDVRQTSRGLRVQIGEVAKIVRGIVNGIYAELDEGNDTFTSTLDVPTTVFGGNGNDTITTAGGRDLVDAGAGNAVIDTGAERDKVIFDGDTVRINMGTGGGEIQGTTHGPTEIVARTGKYVLNLGGFKRDPSTIDPAYTLRLTGGIYRIHGRNVPMDVRIDSPHGSYIEAPPASKLVLGDGDDVVTVEGSSTAEARGGNDVIRSKGHDTGNTVYGGEGNDRVTADGFLNLVYGGAGNDTLLGGTRRDTLHGDEGNDYIDPGAGNDRVIGGPGNDRLITREATRSRPGVYDYVDGGAGRDTVLADDRDDLFNIETVAP